MSIYVILAILSLTFTVGSLWMGGYKKWIVLGVGCALGVAACIIANVIAIAIFDAFLLGGCIAFGIEAWETR